MRIDALFSQGVPQARVQLNVDGRDWIARLQRVDSDAVGFRSWVGDIEGIPYSHVVFTERDGTVSGLINAVSSTYRIRTAEAGTYLLERMAADTPRGETRSRWSERRAPKPLRNDRKLWPDTASTIDVLMLYTPNARVRAGGVSQIQATAVQVISDSNTIFGRSNVTTRLRLAGTAEFALTEASSMASDLNQLTDSTTSHAMRDTYRADLVQLLKSSPDMTVCGLGWLLTSLSSTNFDAYSVVDVDCVPHTRRPTRWGTTWDRIMRQRTARPARSSPYSYRLQGSGARLPHGDGFVLHHRHLPAHRQLLEPRHLQQWLRHR